MAQQSPNESNVDRPTFIMRPVLWRGGRARSETTQWYRASRRDRRRQAHQNKEDDRDDGGDTSGTITWSTTTEHNNHPGTPPLWNEQKARLSRPSSHSEWPWATPPHSETSWMGSISRDSTSQPRRVGHFFNFCACRVPLWPTGRSQQSTSVVSAKPVSEYACGRSDPTHRKASVAQKYTMCPTWTSICRT